MQPTNNHIIVIGAGASGLMAANILAERHSVTVVEARDRIGGRIHTDLNSFSSPVERGAEFMHGKQPMTEKLIHQAAGTVTLLSGNRFQLWDGQLQAGDYFDEGWDRLTRQLQELKDDTDLASFLSKHFNGDQYKDLRKKVKAFVEGYDAAELDRVSAMALGEEWAENDDEHQYHITGGYSALMLHLQKHIEAKGGTILYSSPVSEVHWSPGKVSLHAGKNVLEADRVIITVPLGVLQQKSISFHPPLPDHMNAFSKMGFGGVIKFFFEFKDAFWEDRIPRPLKDVAFVFSDAAVPTWWSQLPHRLPLLIGWLGGPSAVSANHDREALFRQAVSSLQYIFSCGANTIEKEIRHWDVADWLRDEYSFGAYAYPTVASRSACDVVTKPVNDTIYFAGEAVYNGPAMGSVEAALVSGKNVAGRILGR